VNKDTVLAWWVRLGERGLALWAEGAQGKVQVGVVQLDELHTLVKKRAPHLTELEAQAGEVGSQWVWTALDPVHKLLLVAQGGAAHARHGVSGRPCAVSPLAILRAVTDCTFLSLRGAERRSNLVRLAQGDCALGAAPLRSQ